MIMPTKYLKEDEALIGVVATFLQHIKSQRNISSLWEDVINDQTVCTFERFILALDFLFLLGFIELIDNEI
jgi:hypothetical protein